MNSMEFVCEQLSDGCIKEEFYDDTSSAGENVFWKCGEVMLDYNDSLILVCVLCFQEYNEMEPFGSHLRTEHNMVYLSKPEIANGTANLENFSNTSHFSDSEVEGDEAVKEVGKTREELQVEHFASTNEEDHYINGIVQFESVDLPANPNDSSSDEKLDLVKEKIAKSQSTSIRYECVRCDRKYSSKKALVAHIKKEHGGGNSTAKGVTCTFCNLKFDNASNLKDHLESHIGSRRYACPHCEKTFSTAHLRKAHLYKHTGERPFTCTYCPKAFPEERKLRMHIEFHLGLGKYSCDYCGKKFGRRCEKELHERIHTGEKPYQCEKCGKRYISQAKLSEHLKRHKNIKNFKCNVCQKAFYNALNLKDHMISHSGVKPHKCDVCGQKFPRRKSLRAHQQLHSGEHKYVCNVCGKAFAQCAGLYSHRKTHGAALC